MTLKGLTAAILAAYTAFSPIAALANTTTANLGLNKPGVGADSDAWGTYLNANADTLEALFSSGPVLKLANGGTGASTASGARTALGLGAVATQGYATGSWTPTVSFSTAGTSSFSYATQSGKYTCIGNLVFADFNLSFTPTLGTASGSFSINALPYAVVASAQGVDAGVLSTISASVVGYSSIVLRASGANAMQPLSYTAGSTSSALTPSNFTNSTSTLLVGSIVYQTSATC
jgi:hypothetical protein